ncbi:aromatic aminotransferase ISS1-like isoform X2 [Zingiber officinale]|uniref:aromatic aminotransferase ISS1-like isoform X2 n=1 Tax=Zingiber officinale TaxID=94328 RepID=UPI001C4B4B79|nr:aromatic aminotransferase ISS1-like isoform X2 [Zingiber officinale]
MGSKAKLSKRALETDTPVMVQIQKLMRGAKDAISLAQGVVYWQPPEQALEKVQGLVWEPSISKYGADEGLPELRQALIEKLQRENNLNKVAVMITAGANQMTGITDILVGPTDSKTLQPDIEWLERTLSQDPVPKLVTVVNPGNPSGAYIPKPLLLKMSDLCKRAGAWFVVDNTYEYFMYDGLKHSCIEDDHIVNIFSFSKAYGMMGWRVGYIAYPEAVDGFAAQLLKIQDNIPICASIISQRLALHSLEVGPEWVQERVQNLIKNREMLVQALAPLGEENVKGGEGAIYLWAKLPEEFPDDYEVVRWLVKKHHVVVIPGSASGGPGYLRVSFGGLKEADCEVAAYRLKKGLEELMKDGMVE